MRPPSPAIVGPQSIRWLERLSHTGDSGTGFAYPAQHKPGDPEPRWRNRRLTIRISTEADGTVTTIQIEGTLTSASVPDVRALIDAVTA